MTERTKSPRGAALLIVPDALYAAIHRRLDALFVEFPDAEKDRDALYHQLLEAFDQYGFIPDFTLEKRQDQQHQQDRPAPGGLL